MAPDSIRISRTYASITTRAPSDVYYFKTLGDSRQGYQKSDTETVLQGTTAMPRDAATFVTMAKLYLPEDAGNRGVISFVSNRFNYAFLDTAENIANAPSTNLLLSMQQGGAVGTADEWVRYDDVTVFCPTPMDFGTEFAQRTILYENEFNAVPGAGDGFTLSGSGTTTIDNGALTMTETSSSPYNYDISMTNVATLGRPLQVGEYVEVGLRRETVSFIGIGCTGTGIFRNSGTGANCSFGMWRGVAAQLYGPRPSESSERRLTASDLYVFKPADNAFAKMGIRLDYADGEFQVMSVYFDRKYATSWYWETTNTGINEVNMSIQSSTSDQSGKFDYIRVWGGIPPAGTTISIR